MLFSDGGRTRPMAKADNGNVPSTASSAGTAWPPSCRRLLTSSVGTSPRTHLVERRVVGLKSVGYSAGGEQPWAE
eukprot:1564299-Pyramimonas_sp.AAC.1